MTVAATYLNNDTRVATLRVRVGGVNISNVISAEWSFAFQQVPTATIRVPNPAPATAVFRQSVTIDIGFNGEIVRAFTGTVLNVNTDATGCDIECQGLSSTLDNTFHKVVLTVDGGDTAEELVEGLLDDAGVPHYSVNLPDWTPGTQVLSVDPDKDAHPVLEFQTYGEAITKIAEVDGGRWYELPTGTVLVRVADPIPSLSAWRTYFSMQLTGMIESYPVVVPAITAGYRPRLRNISSAQKVRDVKNRCYVTGCTYEQTNADGTISAIDVEGDASASSPWVLNPDGSQAYNDELFPNELIDTPAKAGEVAGRIVAVKNRLLTEIVIEVDGDPEPVLGVTVRVEDPSYSVVTGRWFLEAYSTRIDSRGFSTSLTLLGGVEAGGTINISPFALFTYTVDYEVIGDRLWAVVTFDASGSIDPDGTITNYAFIDNQGPHVINVSGADYVQTVRFDPSVYTEPLEVTLTVTDNDGATDAITLTVLIDPGNPSVTVPALFVAFDTWFSASPDGGQTWNDKAAPGGDTVISVAAKYDDGVTSGVGIYGTTLGALYRTTDFCTTAPTLVMAACGHPITHICWDWNHPTVCWAVSRNGKLFWSWDNGVTWVLYEDLAALWGLTNIRVQRVSTPVPNGVWVWGGTGTGYPLIAYDAVLDHHWVGATLGGELLTDVEAGGPPADLYIADAAALGGGVLAIILNSSTLTDAVYCTADVFDPTLWKRCIGAVPVNSRGQWLAGDWGSLGGYNQFVFGYDNDKTIYRGDAVAGVMTASVAAAAMDVGDEGNYCVPLGLFNAIYGMSGTYILAAEGTADGTLYKSWDRFTTIAKLRPATGFPADAHGTSSAADNTSLTDSSKNWVVNRYVGRTITSNGKSMVITSNTATKQTGTGWSGGGNPGSPHAYTIFPTGANAKMIAVGASGLATESQGRILIAARLSPSGKKFAAWRTGYGNWTTKVFDTELGTGTAGERVRALTANLWFIFSYGGYANANDRIVRTKNGSAAVPTWDSVTTPKSGNDYWIDFAIDAGGRVWGVTTDIVTTGYVVKIWYSDDQGDTWTLSSTQTGSALYPLSGLSLGCHPSNQNIIALRCLRGTLTFANQVKIVYTLDRGASWGTNNPTGSRGTVFPANTGFKVCDNNRLIIWFYGSSDSYVATSDDWGATWTLRSTFHASGSSRLLGAANLTGSKAFGWGIGTGLREIRWAQDYGVTWVAFDNQPGGGEVSGLAYDPVDDVLYAFTSDNTTSNLLLVSKMSPVVQAGTWIDFSDALLPIGADTKYYSEWSDAIAVIPR